MTSDTWGWQRIMNSTDFLSHYVFFGTLFNERERRSSTFEFCQEDSKGAIFRQWFYDWIIFYINSM